MCSSTLSLSFPQLGPGSAGGQSRVLLELRAVLAFQVIPHGHCSCICYIPPARASANTTFSDATSHRHLSEMFPKDPIVPRCRDVRPPKHRRGSPQVAQSCSHSITCRIDTNQSTPRSRLHSTVTLCQSDVRNHNSHRNGERHNQIFRWFSVGNGHRLKSRYEVWHFRRCWTASFMSNWRTIPPPREG